MIKLEQELQSYIDFINEYYPSDEVVEIKPLYGYTTVTCNDDTVMGFAVYLPESRTIGLPMDVPKDLLQDNPYTLLRNLAHEYKHFLDDVAGKKYTKKREIEADKFAENVVENYKTYIVQKDWRMYVLTKNSK